MDVARGLAARLRAGGAAPPATADAPLTSSILTQQELLPLELGRQLQREREAQAERVAARRRRTEAEQRAMQRQREEAALRARLAQLPPGPNLPPHRRHTAQLDVQQEDLEDLLPDGWGLHFPDECRLLARRIGVPPAAVPILLILAWCHGLRAPARKSARMTGAALCAVPEWLARKAGCSVRWVHVLVGILDPWAEHRREKVWTAVRNAIRQRHGKPALPTPPAPGGGTALIQRHPRVKLYSALQRDVPAAARLAKWRDAADKLHDWVDLRGRYYATVQGLRALLRRRRRHHRPRPGRMPELLQLEMQRDLFRRLRPIYRRLRARLNAATALALPEDFTPNNVPLAYSKVFRRGSKAVAGPDPPRGGGAPAGRRQQARHQEPKRVRSSAAAELDGGA